MSDARKSGGSFENMTDPCRVAAIETEGIPAYEEPGRDYYADGYNTAEGTQP